MAQTRSSCTFDEYIIPKIWNTCREDYMDENEEVSHEVDARRQVLQMMQMMHCSFVKLGLNQHHPIEEPAPDRLAIWLADDGDCTLVEIVA